MNIIIPKDISKKDANKLAQDLLGISYKHLGRDSKGLDCWGVVIYFYTSFNYNIQDWKEYEQDWHLKNKNYFLANFYADYHKRWKEVEIPAVGDTILFENRKGMFDHAGILLDTNKFLHCPKAGVIISNFTDYWKDKNPKYYRLKVRDKYVD